MFPNQPIGNRVWMRTDVQDEERDVCVWLTVPQHVYMAVRRSVTHLGLCVLVCVSCDGDGFCD